MSFTTEIKNEICSNKYSRLENIAMLSGFIRNNYEFDGKKILLSIENPKVVRKIFSLLKELFDITPVVFQGKNVNFNKKSYYNIFIFDRIDIVRSSLLLFDENNVFISEIPKYFLDSEDLKRSYLRGLFLSRGSVNDPKKSRYHLEFLGLKKTEAGFVMELLSFFEIKSKVLIRDNGYMVYVKEAEKIGDFLRIISANNAVLYYEDIRIYRDHKNMTNRLNNCEQANVDKIISASGKQIEDINLLIDKIGIDALDEKLRDVVIYRLKYPEVSLSELSFIISSETGKNITKSGLNHRFRKIHEIVDKIS